MRKAKKANVSVLFGENARIDGTCTNIVLVVIDYI